jgi:hypothetical protein
VPSPELFHVSSGWGITSCDADASRTAVPARVDSIRGTDHCTPILGIPLSVPEGTRPARPTRVSPADKGSTQAPFTWVLGPRVRFVDDCSYTRP